MSSSKSLSKRATKEELIKRADELVIKAKAEVIELRRKGEWALAMELEAYEKTIDLIQEVVEQAPTETADIKNMEVLLQETETRLNDWLQELEQSATKKIMTKDDLLRVAHELVTLAKAEILDQRKAGKKMVAAQLEVQEKALLKIAEQIEAAVADTPEIEAAEKKLKEAESNLRQALRKLENN